MAKSKKTLHNLSSRLITSGELGKIIPLYARDVLPGEKLSVLPNYQVRFTAMPNILQDKLYFITHAFAVPYSQLHVGTPDVLSELDRTEDKMRAKPEYLGDNDRVERIPWMRYDRLSNYSMQANTWLACTTVAPQDRSFKTAADLGLDMQGLRFGNIFDPGTIYNSLGFTRPPGETAPGATGTAYDFAQQQGRKLNLWIPMAYNHIYQEYFRDEEFEKKWVDFPLNSERDYQIRLDENLRVEHPWGSTVSSAYVADRLWSGLPPFYESGHINPTYWMCADAVKLSSSGVASWRHRNGPFGLFGLRDANWEMDRFVRMRPSPQRGNAVVIPANGTIDDLREAVATQNFRLKLQRSGQRWSEFLRRVFGTSPSEGTQSIPYHLSTGITELALSDINQTSPTQGDFVFGNPASYSVSDVYHGHKFDWYAEEHCIVMQVGIVMPRTLYDGGLDSSMFRVDTYDYFLPDFEAIGDQPVYAEEINAGAVVDAPSMVDRVSGYNPPWEDYRTAVSRVGGQFSQFGGSVPFINQTFRRDLSATSVPAISASFIKSNVAPRPFAITTDGYHHAQFYCDFNVTSLSPVPHYIDDKCITH